MPKNVQVTAQFHSSHTLIFKILQTRFQQYVNCDIPDVQIGFRKGRGTRDQIATICWIITKEESSRQKSTFSLLTAKSFD